MPEGVPDPSHRPYLTESDEHLWDLVEHLYQEGHWQVEDQWAQPLWAALTELHRRLGQRADEEIAQLRARADRRRALLDRCLPYLSDDVALADEVTLELYEEQPYPRVRPAGYDLA